MNESDWEYTINGEKVRRPIFNGHVVRKFDHHTKPEDVENMTVWEAAMILSRWTNCTGHEWSPRPHLAKACQMAVEALEKEGERIGQDRP